MRTALCSCFLAVFALNAAKDTVPAEFTAGIQRYMDLRKEAVRGVTALPVKATPEQILQHKRAEAEAIRRARATAQPGDILTPPAQAFLKGILQSEMSGKKGQPARQAAKQGNPAVTGEGAPVVVEVNGTYPDNAPASTVPPTVLLRLPKLPKELDFRFVGRQLILRDISAGVIVDFIPNAMP